MKRVGEPLENDADEKIPRLNERTLLNDRNAEKEQGVEEVIEEIVIDGPSLNDGTDQKNILDEVGINESATGNDANAERNEEMKLILESMASKEEVSIDRILATRIVRDSLGLYCYWFLKDALMNLDVVSLIVPFIHFHSRWNMELIHLEKLQRERMVFVAKKKEEITAKNATSDPDLIQEQFRAIKYPDELVALEVRFVFSHAGL
jgi:hypothetical protein